MESESEDQTTLMLHAAATQILVELESLFLAAGLVCQAITTESIGWRAAIRNHVVHRSRAIVIVPREHTLETVAFVNGCLVSHQIRRLRGDTESESNQSTRFVGEIRRCGISLASFFGREEPYDVILLGTHEKWSTFAEQVKAELSTEVSIASPDEMATWRRCGSAEEFELYKSVIATSAALTGENGLSINFIKPSKPRSPQRRRLLWACGAAVAASLTLALLAIGAARSTNERQTRLDLLRAREDRLAARLKQLTGAERMARFFGERREKQVDWIQAWKELRKHLPDNKRCYLSRLVCTTPKQGGPSGIRGQLLADGPPTILEINQRILNGQQFELQPRGAQPSRRDDKYPIYIDLEATLKPLSAKPLQPATEDSLSVFSRTAH